MHPIFSVFNWSFLKILYAFMPLCHFSLIIFFYFRAVKLNGTTINGGDNYFVPDSGEVKAIPLPASYFLYDPRKLPVFSVEKTGVFPFC